MWLYWRLFLVGLGMLGRRRRDLILENLILRQQLAVWERSGRRPRLQTRDRLWCFKTLSALCESRPPESLHAEGRRCGSNGDCFWSGWGCSAGGDGI